MTPPPRGRAYDGSFALVYLPTNRPVVVDLSKLVGEPRITWFDPTDGSQKPADHKPWRGTSWREFTPPATNAGGDADFVLLLEADAAGK